MTHWRRMGEGMMNGVGMMWSHMAVSYGRRMVKWRVMMVIMDGGSSLSSRDSVGAEGNYRVGEGVCVQSLVCQERVDLHLRAGCDCEAVELQQS